MKESDCNKTQIFYPKTKRCIKKNTKKAIEYLFNKGDTTIHKKYEMVDGKIVKQCEKTKIRNPDTKRCIKNKNVIKNKSVSLGKKIEAIKKAKKALSPFVNRVSADIYHRNKYLILMRRELKNKKRGCLKVYKQYSNNKFSYRIGNKIILKKRIGTDSVYGIVYLSEFREKEKKMFTYASKVYVYSEKKVNMEIGIFDKMTELVRMDMCPHFPLLYGYVICDSLTKTDNDSFIKSNKNDISISQNIKKLPDLIRFNLYSKIITTFTELANGDLWNFINLYEDNGLFIANALIQQFISIMFFNYYIKRIHMDCHPGNFLYHKIKAGGYFHYNFFGVDYYLENVGFLWVIWDFDLSKTLIEAMDIYKIKKNSNDYLRILSAYMPYKNFGYCKNASIINNNELQRFVNNIYQHQKFLYINERGYNIKSLKEFIISLPLFLSNIKLNGNYVLLRKLPQGATIINKTPYKMVKEELFN